MCHPVTTSPLGVAFPSSQANEHYGLIGPLVDWPLPSDLCGYKDLPNHAIYYPNNYDPTVVIITEADDILTAMHTMFNDVNIELASNASGYQIRCSSEESHSVPVEPDTGRTYHLSRVDKSWSYNDGQKFIRFTVLEFKRPGAIKQVDWFSTTDSTVTGTGANICRQLKKYAYSFSLHHVGVCDLDTLMLLHLGGDRNDWLSSMTGTAPTTGARYRCITQRDQMKRHLYVFLKEALHAMLLAHGSLS
jgi:hypothetical protein